MLAQGSVLWGTAEAPQNDGIRAKIKELEHALAADKPLYRQLGEATNTVKSLDAQLVSNADIIDKMQKRVVELQTARDALERKRAEAVLHEETVRARYLEEQKAGGGSSSTNMQANAKSLEGLIDSMHAAGTKGQAFDPQAVARAMAVHVQALQAQLVATATVQAATGDPALPVAHVAVPYVAPATPTRALEDCSVDAASKVSRVADGANADMDVTVGDAAAAVAPGVDGSLL